MPIIGNEKMVGQAQMAQMVSDKMYDMQAIFHHFINNSWIYESKQTQKILEVMSDEERVLFNHNIKSIDWDEMLYAFSYGLRRFFIKEDVLSPDMNYEQLLVKTATPYGHDIRTALKGTRTLQPKDNIAYFSSVLSK